MNNILNFRTTKRCVDRLSPNRSQLSTYQTSQNRKGSYYKANEGAPRLYPDPIAVAVDVHRLRERARSTLRATPKVILNDDKSIQYRSLFLQKGEGMGQNFFKTPKPQSIKTGNIGRNNLSGFN